MADERDNRHDGDQGEHERVLGKPLTPGFRRTCPQTRRRSFAIRLSIRWLGIP